MINLILIEKKKKQKEENFIFGLAATKQDLLWFDVIWGEQKLNDLILTELVSF